MSEELLIKPIAHIYTDFTEKFGIPRQSGLIDELKGRIVFEPQYRRFEALKELDGFSHIWLIWHFSQADTKEFSPTVRPPRLGGNRRVGVFASRSPFRPNSLGLSCVKLEGIDYEGENAPVIYVSGIDMLNGTPIFDIKPYIPVADLKADAAEGYTADTKNYFADVDFPDSLLSKIPENKRSALIKILKNDPRPSYKADEAQRYGLSFAGFNIVFDADGKKIKVKSVEKI